MAVVPMAKLVPLHRFTCSHMQAALFVSLHIRQRVEASLAEMIMTHYMVRDRILRHIAWLTKSGDKTKTERAIILMDLL